MVKALNYKHIYIVICMSERGYRCLCVQLLYLHASRAQ